MHLARFLDNANISKSTKTKIDEAFKELSWLLKNVPCLHTSLYVKGEEFLNRVSKDETSGKRRRAFEHKLTE